MPDLMEVHDILEILVKNPGHVNFSVLDDERKSLLCTPTIEGF